MDDYYHTETIDEILEREKLGYIEQQNPIREEELKDPHRAIKIDLLGIIATYQEPVCCNRIFRDFEEVHGYQLDPSVHGFKSFTSMMRTFSDKFIAHNTGERTTYTAKKSERSEHLQDLIANQTTIEQRNMRRARSYSRSRKSNYGAGIFYAQNFVPLHDDDRTLEERTAANLSAFGRSLATETGMDWGGRRSRLDDSTSDDDVGGMVTRSKSVPASRSPMQNGGRRAQVLDDPKGTRDPTQCTNPFRVQNNVRIRDIVIIHGENDTAGRKGMSVMEVAATFRREHRLPLGGIPNISEDRLLAKMEAVETEEWTVERLGDGVAYVIIPAETLKKAKELGPGTPISTGPVPEKPKSTGLSPAAKRMFGFAIKAAASNNDRMRGTREQVLDKRSKEEESEEEYEMGADSDGDPCMVLVPKERKKLRETAFDRDALIALNTHVPLDRDLSWKVASMRLNRSTKTSPVSSGSSSTISSLSGMSGGAIQPANGPSSGLAPPESSSSMWSSVPSSASKPSSGFGGGGAPTFGTFKSTPPPASLGVADKDDDSSQILQPAQSNLASRLPQTSFSSAPKDVDDSGYSEQLGVTEPQPPVECDLRREMRAHLGMPSPRSEDDEIIIEEEEECANDDVYSQPMFPPGLASVPPPPGMGIGPPYPMYQPIPPPFLPGGLWVPTSSMMAPRPFPLAPIPQPPGFFLPHPFACVPPPGLLSFPPGLSPLARLMQGPPPGLWASPPPLLHPPGLPRPPNKEHPVEYKGEVYYEEPNVWPPPLKNEKRERKALLIEAPPDTSVPSSSFPSTMGGGSTIPTFGTGSKSLVSPSPAPRALPTFGAVSASSSPAPRALPTFGATSASSSATPRALPTFGATTASSSSAQSFPSAFGGSQTSTAAPAASTAKASEVLDSTAKLIEKLISGAAVYMHQIEGSPVEEVIAGNPDFFDIDENELVHLLHKDVKAELLLFEGKTLEDMVEKEEAPKEARGGMFSKPPGFAVRTLPTFGNPPSASFTTSRTEPSEQQKPRELPTFGANLSRPVMEQKQPVVSMPVKNAPGMPSFGTRSLEVPERPDSALSNRSNISEEPKKVREMPTFGGATAVSVQREENHENRSEEPRKLREMPTFGGATARPVQRAANHVRHISTSSDSTIESVVESNYTTAPSGPSSRNGASLGSLSTSSMHSSQETMEVEQKKEEVVEKEKEPADPYDLPDHSDIRRLAMKTSLRFGDICKGEIHMASVLTSFVPNRLMLTIVEGGMMENLNVIMAGLRHAYVDSRPMDRPVKLGQFAVAINGECVVRVVVVRQPDPNVNEYECACLDINALITVPQGGLHELNDRFGVHAVPAITFIARVNGIKDLERAGHKAVKLVAKGTPEDDSVKTFQPFIFHGKDRTGELVVDVAVSMATEIGWMGEAFPKLIGLRRDDLSLMNPDIEKAIELAAKYDLEAYVTEKMKKVAVTEEAQSDTDTPNEKDLLTMRSTSVEEGLNREPTFVPVKRESMQDEEKEEGELDSSRDESIASERTPVVERAPVDRNAAGDFVREVKEQKPDDEFVVVAPVGPKPVIDVQSMVSLIGLLNEKGENVEVDVIKSMSRALILSINKTLSSLGERGALIANAEALDAIEMA